MYTLYRSYIVRKYPGNDLEKRLVFSRWRNIDNDSVDATWAGKSFQIRGLTTLKVQWPQLTA